VVSTHPSLDPTREFGADYTGTMHFLFEYLSAAPLSEETQRLFMSRVRDAATGMEVQLGNFLTTATSRVISGPSLSPAVAIVCWGQGCDDAVFARLISTVNGLQILGADWNTEGIGGDRETGDGVFWVSGFPKGYAGLDPATIYKEISTTSRMDEVESVLSAWQKYLVDPAAKNDPLSFVVVAVAQKENEAREIVNAVIRGIRNYVL
jgi:hypothetical protein